MGRIFNLSYFGVNVLNNLSLTVILPRTNLTHHDPIGPLHIPKIEIGCLHQSQALCQYSLAEGAFPLYRPT